MNLRALLLIVIPMAVQSDYQTGLDAFYEGDFDLAMEEWLAVAESSPGSATPGEVMESHYAIAMLYWSGIGVPQDYGKAYQWLQKPAQMNHADAQSKLGVLYSHGTAVELDYDEAFSWFSKAAKQGNVDAIYNLGVLYLNGWGTERDITLAKQYLAQASALGDVGAEKALQQVIAETQVDSASADPEVDERASAFVSEPESLSEPQLQSEPEPQAEPEPELEPGLLSETEAEHTVLADTSWIVTRQAEHYTIQVIALSTREKIEALIAGHEALAPFALYTVSRDSGGHLFVLLQGDYPNVEAARAARDAFPQSIQDTDSLWIRKFGRIQSLIGN